MGFFVRLNKVDRRYIEELISKDIQSLGCVVWGIELSGKMLSQTLRIFIDKEKGVSIEDCEKVSRHISKLLEASDDLNLNLNLEVSSPGIERKFFKKNQYSSYLNHLIKIRYKTEDNLFVTRKGTLEKVNPSGLVLKSGSEDFNIKFDCIEKAKLQARGKS